MRKNSKDFLHKKKFSLDQIDELKFITIIIKPELEKDIITRLEELGGRVLLRENAEGIGKNMSLELLGLQRSPKVVIFGAARSEDANNLVLALDSEFNFAEPGAGLGFTINVDGFAGAKGLFV